MSKSRMRASFAAWRAAHLVERLARLQRAAGFEGGLNPVQWEALRYIARANRFSRTPAALADFLNATRGTVSQTLIALEGKGLIEKTRSVKDARSQSLALTDGGRALLDDDPEAALARDIDETGDAALVSATLEGALRRALAPRGGKPFGPCKTCRHFRRGAGAHHCALLNEPLSAQDAEAICVEMEAA
ncbi:MAG: MarR family transcriptional regulator [Parvularculaceae bacterium]|nr:MarR family transcriptional regulator [Parvularculaceae bacterium]